ncbi:ketopantoate reductase family protein [Verminephrobacter aporrectodeae subsp. tuberculatae]|uniref:2-dehydropantoate 2-reductase n=1 Tax=Verminephrobacter aporrectodeae subsp. tuberculatae TaxID=1110392 RepID=A0ABT3KY36_9BURK|nr:2-dehydropantoate 2-reductase [Verminephrobacter aporrectodeae]MCW5322715.1 ketopantoate reductase family protein [Verminephrobacter aporrectodeae subsp. tuberculatae]
MAASQWYAHSPILIWGGGAIGGCVAALLARAGVPVKMVDIVADHVQASRTGGLRIEGPVVQCTQRVDAATPAELRGRHDCILLAVKAQHTRAALTQLLAHLSDDGVVVSLQNGLNETLIAGSVGAHRTVAGCVNFAADYLAPGRIGYGNRGALKLGELRPGLTPRVTALAELLRAFDGDTTAVPDIWPFKWGKLAYGSLLFATALANEPMSESLADPQHRPLFVALAREVIGVADLAGVQPLGFDGFDPAAFRAGASAAAAAHSLDRMAQHYRHSGKQRSGVWRDLAVRQRRTEVDSQMGEIVRIAQSRGTNAPITEQLIRRVHEIEERRRDMARANLVEFAAAVQAWAAP